MQSMVVLAGVAVGAGLVFRAVPSPAVPQCGLKSLDGTYGFRVDGTNVGGALVPGPVSAVGIATADGAGNLTGADTVSANGTIVPRTLSGVYTVNANCTGQATFTDNFAQTTHLNFVIVQNREEFSFIQTDPGAVTTGVAKKQ
jgi:hypothetical protein